MPRQAPLLAVAAALAVLFSAQAAGGDGARLLFTGDVLLSRQVEVEISKTGRFPWEALADEFARADLVVGNLEGSVGTPADCPVDGKGPCFAIAPSRIPLLARARFGALTLENNHAGDLGDAGRERTRTAAWAAGISPVDFASGPTFFHVRGMTVALVALNLVPGRDGRVQGIPSPEVRRALRLASRLAGIVVVSVHWGEELLDWPSEAQREAARWLVANGASLVVGHHPHVVQAASCVEGRPVFYSLGNHLFDQKYPATKEGLIADCRIEGGTLSCSALATRTPPGSFRPAPADGGPASAATASLASCRVPLGPPLEVAGTPLRPSARGDAASLVLEGLRGGQVAFRSRPSQILSIEKASLSPDGPPLLLTLERHPSPIDGERGVRPYVYEVGPRGLVARWRGSALAWPLVDATILPGTSLLCALHRGDSFLALDPAAPASRAAVYRWNGFGFTGEDDAAQLAACRALWGL